MTRVALATCAAIPELEPDDQLLLPALAAHGIGGAPAVWDDAAVDWNAFDLVLLRSTWDYAERRDEFLAWARSLPRVLNDVPLLEWNTDKERYLTNLDEAGVAIVGTHFVKPGEVIAMSTDPLVVKPAISAGGRRSARFTSDEHAAAQELIARIHAEGRTAMIQQFIDGEEKALVYIGGNYSHALRRRVPLPSGGERSVLYLEEELAPAEATSRERETAEAALACAPAQPLYARVDLLGGAVLEVELAEPSLYFAFGTGSAERLAKAVAATLAA